MTPEPRRVWSAQELFAQAAEKLKNVQGPPPASSTNLSAETTTTTKKRVSYFEDNSIPVAAEAETAPTPQELLSRARLELNKLHPQTTSSTSPTSSFYNVTSTGAAIYSPSPLGFKTSTSPLLSVSDLRNVSLSVSDLSTVSLSSPHHHDNQHQTQNQTTTDSPRGNTTKAKVEMPINRDNMFRRKPVPISTNIPLPSNTGPKIEPVPKSSAFSNLREARNASLPDALNTFSKQFRTTQQHFTQKGHVKEINLDLNGNGTSAPFLRQHASTPGRKVHFVENFGDGKVDERISGPLEGAQMSDCRGVKAPMTVDGKGYTGYVNPKRNSDTKTDAVIANSDDIGTTVHIETAETRTVRPSDPTLRPPQASTGPTLRPSDSMIRPFIITTGSSTTETAAVRPSIGITRPSDEIIRPLMATSTNDSGQVTLSEGISVVNDNLMVPKTNQNGEGKDKNNVAATGIRRVIRKVSGGLIFNNTRKPSGREDRPPVPPKDKM